MKAGHPHRPELLSQRRLGATRWWSATGAQGGTNTQIECTNTNSQRGTNKKIHRYVYSRRENNPAFVKLSLIDGGNIHLKDF